MNSQQEPMVTVRLSFLVKSLLLGFRSHVTLNEKNSADYKKLIQDIKAGATESLCHIQDYNGDTIIWNPADWTVDIQRYEMKKAESEKRVETFNRGQEIKEELMKLICIKMGNVGIEKTLADNIINNKIIAMVQQLGGSTDLCERIKAL